jgi:uncharacterized protein
MSGTLLPMVPEPAIVQRPGFEIPLRTRVFASAGELPFHDVFWDRPQLETEVQLIELRPGVYCLNHSLKQQQMFGGPELRDAYAALQAGRSGAIDAELLDALQEGGFLAGPGQARDREHRRLMALEDEKEIAEPSFTLLRILLTDQCNLACSYCKVIPNIDNPSKHPIAVERLNDVIKFYFTYSDPLRPKIIHMTGGEPTIFFDTVRAIIELKEKHERPNENVWFVLGTNATRLDAAKAKFLAEKDVKCIVSMDGPQEIHDTLRRNWVGQGSWKDVDRGIKLLKDAGAEVSLSMVMGQHSIHTAHETIDWFLDEYQPTGLGVNFMKPPTPDQKDYQYLIGPQTYAETMYSIHKAFRDRGLFLELVYRKLQPFVDRRYRYHDCGAAGGTTINVDAKGNIGPCKSFLVMKKLALEDLNADAYRNTVVARWRKRSPIYYEACGGCSARGMCGNGCAYDAAIHSGDEMAIDIRSCEYTKYFNRLFLEDLLDQVWPSDRASAAGWFHVPTQAERQKLLGDVRARPRTLSYSIGHQTSE